MPIEDNLESTNKDREIEKKSIIQRQPRLMFATFLLVCFFFFFFSGFVFSKWQRTYCLCSYSWLFCLVFSCTDVTVYIHIKPVPFHSSTYQHLQGHMVPWDPITPVIISVKACRGKSLQLLLLFLAVPQASRYQPFKIYIYIYFM